MYGASRVSYFYLFIKTTVLKCINYLFALTNTDNVPMKDVLEPSVDMSVGRPTIKMY